MASASRNSRLDDYSALNDLLPADPALDDISAPIDELVGCKRVCNTGRKGTDQQKSPKALANQRHRLVFDQIAHLQEQNGVDACAR
jgi:hypothetical protein